MGLPCGDAVNCNVADCNAQPPTPNCVLKELAAPERSKSNTLWNSPCGDPLAAMANDPAAPKLLFGCALSTNASAVGTELNVAVCPRQILAAKTATHIATRTFSPFLMNIIRPRVYGFGNLPTR